MHYEPVRATFHGELWTQDKAWCHDIPPGVNVIESADGKGLSDDPAIIHQGANSGYQAINLAYHLGAKTILLLGYDMGDMDGRKHWHGDHPTPLGNPVDFAGLRKNFATIKPERHGINIINCSRRTALDCFPKMDLNEALRQARHHPRHRPQPGTAA